MDKNELLTLKDDIENAKMEVSKMIGQKETLVKQLRTEWNCKTVEEAEKMLKKMEKEIDDIKRQIEESIKKIEEKYNDK